MQQDVKTYRLVIGGRLVDAPDDVAIHDPATGRIVGRAPLATPAQVDDAVHAAAAAFPAWARTSDDVRKAACIAMADEDGNGLDEDVVLGPLQNRMQFDRVVRLVDGARADGAHILSGGGPIDGPGFFYPVTLVAEARDGMALVDEEQFGPVLPILRYTDIDDAVARANASENGLGASVWSSDAQKARAIGARLEAGTVWINKHGAIRPDTPFGGVKASGIGVEFGQQGLEEYTTIQVLHR